MAIARVSSGGGPSAGAVGLEFPSKGIRREFWNSLRREFEGNTEFGKVLEVLCVVSGTSCIGFIHV